MPESRPFEDLPAMDPVHRVNRSMRAIYYTLSASHAVEETSAHIEQLRMSIQSLRRVNRNIDTYLFNFGVSRSLLQGRLEPYDVIIVEKPDYKDALRAYCGERADALQNYPVHHKWLGLDHFDGREYAQLLYMDADTIFLCDPARLFDAYGTHDWYAREEPFSSCSHLGYDPNYLDEEVLRVLACEQNVRFLQPMNLGVVLMNRRTWKKVHGVLDQFFANIWSLLVWIARHRRLAAIADPRLRPVVEAVSRYEESGSVQALRHPSSNFWITGQIALWLALGRLESFSCGMLNRSDVAQGPEFKSVGENDSGEIEPVICHYFSKNYSSFANWYHERYSL